MNNKLSKILLFHNHILFLLLLFSLFNNAAFGSQKNSIRLSPNVHPNLYSVKIEHGQRGAPSGIIRSYVLYIPQPNSALPGPPYPLVVMVHGFLMSGNQQKNTSQYLAEHGFVVLSPNMTKVLLGSEIRTANVQDVVAQTKWLIDQSQIPNSSYHHLVDPQRTAIAGNSSGGAVCFEAVLEAQRVKAPFHAMCSMEGVPWDRTLDKVTEIEPMQILCLRAEPCLCNYHDHVLKYLARLKFPADDVKINGAHHCDAENPTSIGCISVCGSSHEKYRRLFQSITYLYLRDVLNAPRLDTPNKSFVEMIDGLQKEGKVIAHLDNLQPSSSPYNYASGKSKKVQ